MRKADTHISLKTAVKGLSVMSALMMLVCSPLNVRAEDMEGTQTEGGHGLGYIYVPFDDEIPFIAQSDSEQPLLYESRYYNGYELGLLPEVRDQGSEGACWAFASIGAAEADLIHDGAGTGIDLSEMQIAYFTSHYYTDPTGCHNNDNTYYDGAAGTWLSNGGCVQMAYRAMMDGVGIVTEQTVPYRAGSSLNSFTLSDEYAYGYNAYQLKGAYIININVTNGIKSENTTKAEVMKMIKGIYTYFKDILQS